MTERRLTRQQAINAKCRDCIVDPLAGGNWRQQVSACVATACPLHPYRPVSRPAGVPRGNPQPAGLRRFAAAKLQRNEAQNGLTDAGRGDA